MNFLEKTIATLSPKWAANRSRNRYVLNAYEAAQPSRTEPIRQAERAKGQTLLFAKVRSAYGNRHGR